jgi:hypothetical protein
MPIEVYCSCASKDQRYLDALASHLAIQERHELIRMQKSSDVPPGTMWREEHRRMLNAAQIILFLISADFLSSPFHQEEISQAISMFKRQKALVIPVLLRPVSLAGTPLDLFQPLPHNRKPLALWRNKDQALAEIADKILLSLINLSIPENISLATNPQIPTSTLDPTVSLSPVNPQLPSNLESVLPETITDPSRVMEIVDIKLAQFSNRERRHRRAWKRQQILAISAACSTGIFALFDFFSYRYIYLFSAIEVILHVLVALSSLATLLYVPLLTQSYSAWRWHYYQQRKADLNNEKKLYLSKQGIYALELDRLRVFEERVSQLITNVDVGTESTDETQDYEQP